MSETVQEVYCSEIVLLEFQHEQDVTSQGWKVLYDSNYCKQNSLPPTRLYGEKFTHFLKIFLSIQKIPVKASIIYFTQKIQQHILWMYSYIYS